MSNENTWKTNAFRAAIIAKIEDGIKKSGISVLRNSTEIEQEFFSKAKTKKEYLYMVNKYIISTLENDTTPCIYTNLSGPEHTRTSTSLISTLRGIIDSCKQTTRIRALVDDLGYQQKRKSKFVEPLGKVTSEESVTDIAQIHTKGTSSTVSNMENQGRSTSSHQELDHNGNDSDYFPMSPALEEQHLVKDYSSPSVDHTEDVYGDDLPMSQHESDPSKPRESSSVSDDETEFNVECIQNSLPASPNTSPDSDSDTHINLTQNSEVTYQTINTPVNCPATPRVRVKTNLVNLTTSSGDNHSNSTESSMSPLIITSAMENIAMEETVIHTSVLNEVLPSTSCTQSSGIGCCKKSLDQVSRDNSSATTAPISDDALPSTSEHRRVPPLRINIKSKVNKRNKAVSSERLKILYFKKKLQIARFELYSKKVLYKLECELKRRQLEKMSIN